MNIFPDFTVYGYQITQELGRNRQGGRITWKAKELSTSQTVVIKQFCFATEGSTWSGYRSYQKEITILQKLDHPGIPKYLNVLETDNGFCLIQEYKDALTLTDYRNLELTEIKIVTYKILEILVYLQQQKPLIIHRDLKPENILLDDSLNVYLIDFGLSSLGGQELSSSSIVQGTPGFMPPEQLLKSTSASDLYSLGVTIICLLLNKTTAEVKDLATIDHPYKLDFIEALPPLSNQFIAWLKQMVEPQLSQRFANAQAALKALQAIDIQPTNQNNLVLVAVKPAWLSQINFNYQQRFGLGAFCLTLLVSTAVWAINLTGNSLQLGILNLVVAVMGAIVVTVVELAAATIAITDRQAQAVAIVLAVGIPLLLVILATSTLGYGEAIAITAAIIIAQIFSLAYTLFQQSFLAQQNKKLTTIILLGSIGLGLTLGLRLII